VTLCFSVPQALLAAKAGATFVSPFIGRLDDAGENGMELIRDICVLFENYGFDTEVLAASIRTPDHVKEAALWGAHCATIPPAVFAELIKHPLTDKGLDLFAKDWASTGQSIL
jgi:transaldolase